jgi:hypothetical protein
MRNNAAIGLQVEAYWNLHKRCYSVRHLGRVILHASDLQVLDARLVVQEGGRQRVLREQRKNVHAFVRGTLAGYVQLGKVEGFGTLYHGQGPVLPVSYNPFAGPTFMLKDTGEPIHRARIVRGYSVTYQGTCKPVLKAVP